MTPHELAAANETLTYQRVEARMVIEALSAYVIDMERRMRGEPRVTLHVVPEADTA